MSFINLYLLIYIAVQTIQSKAKFILRYKTMFEHWKEMKIYYILHESVINILFLMRLISYP